MAASIIDLIREKYYPGWDGNDPAFFEQTGGDELALRFARKGAHKFDGLDWFECDNLPRLHTDGGSVACDVENVLPGGDHLIVTGRVLAAEPVVGAPLAYRNRRFGTHTPLLRPFYGAA